MKKLFAITIALLMTVAVCAQEHLAFKGIPITGSIESFCKQLSSKGYKYLGTKDNIYVFEGLFTGQKATILVTGSDEGTNVFAVGVVFEASKEWKILKQTYEYYKDLYTRKYGEPTGSKEYNPATSDSNIALMAEVHEGTIEYGSGWIVEGGEIEIYINKTNGFYEGAVVIRYRDTQNVQQKIESDLEEI